MTRRECGTCQFFEASGIGETGWCRNQRCREIVGLSLVRRQELACRIGWDKDYYEPANGRETIPGQQRPTPDQARLRTGYQGTRPDDIIVGIEQPRAAADPPSPSGGKPRMSNVGEAHRRALERRQVAHQAGESLPARTLSGANVGGDRPAAPPRNDSEARTPPPRGITGDEGVSAPRRAAPPAEERPAVAVAVEAPPAHLAVTTNLSVPSEPPVAAPGPPRRSAPPGMQTSPSPLEPQQLIARPVPGDARGQYRNDAPPPMDYPVRPPDGPPLTPIEAEWLQLERQRHRGKRCANCRDFQAAESGDRGWCRNRFAFPTPQLVGPNDLACLSCIGTWWAANDQWWLAKAPAPSQLPTPLADALLEELQEIERQHATLRRPGAS